jgi:hypothetical protein
MGVPSEQINQLTVAQDQSIQQVIDQVTQLGVPADLTSRLTANLLPGPLGLDDVYDYYETQGQSAARLMHMEFLAVPDQTYQIVNQYVDPTINTLRIVVAGKQGDDNYCGGYTREVGIKPPLKRPYYPVSPPVYTGGDPTPSEWDIRHSDTDDVILIPNPESGEWSIRARYVFTGPCTESGDPVIPETPSALESDFIINASAETNAQLSGRFLPPIVNNVGAAGQYVPMVGTLLYKTGAVPGAIVVALIQRPGGGNDGLILWDDGLHNDGGAGDGIYGNEYRTAILGGTYNVRMIALAYDAIADKWATREWNGGFYMTPDDNPDGDFMPAAWELQCGLDPNKNDAALDKDQDGLVNLVEYVVGTLPCQADTDRGGERDGSEVFATPNARIPLWAPDDLVRPLGHISVIALNEHIRIEWTHPYSYTHMLGWIGTTLPITLTNPIDMGDSGIYTATVPNGDYFVQLEGQNGDAFGDFSDAIAVTPKPDPDAPSGAILINNGAVQTSSRDVILNLSSSDTPLPGLADPASGSAGSPMSLQYNEISAAIEMRISNDPSFTGVSWEPLDQEKPWTLAGGSAGVRIVYAQFRDGAGNVSLVVYDTILYNNLITYLPVITRH